MKKTRRTEEQIAFTLERAETATAIAASDEAAAKRQRSRLSAMHLN